MQSQLCSISDIDQIVQVIKSNPTMYGIDITSHHENLISIITKYIETPSRTNFPICYKKDDKVFGVVLQTLWEEMPFWSAGNLFIDQSSVQGVLFTETVEICHDMLNYMLFSAESRNYYDYFSVVRQSKIGSRDKFLSDKFKTEYNINNLATIMPYAIPEFVLYRKLLGYTCGNNSKQLVIRHASRKGEFRV